jgi:uncharacterized protein YegP (UPF0339 family)
VIAVGKFIIKKTNTGYIFYLKAKNMETLGTSRVYASSAACREGVERVRMNCGGEVEDQTVKGTKPLRDPKFEMYLDKAGRFRFRLKASNGDNILSSEGYNSKAACLHGIESIRGNVPGAAVADETV